jgi:tetratricopeptide (TPR) repeat protein
MRLLVPLLLLVALCARAETDYFAPENLLKFADALYAEQDYLRAAGEYQRYLLAAPATVDRTPVLRQIGLCYREGGEAKRAVAYFVQVHERAPGDRSTVELARAYFDLDDDARAVATLDARPLQAPYAVPGQQLRGLVLLRRRAWRQAAAVLAPSAAATEAERAQLAPLQALAAQGDRLPRKSRLFAAVISAVLPGSGKLYAGRPRDALGTLLILGSTAALAARAFHADGRGSAWGWAYGTLAAGFYAGDIYGAAVAVQVTNDKLERRLLRTVEVTCGIPL